MRKTPSASETVTTAGSPSGMAATARLTEVMNNSNGSVPRSIPSANSSATRPNAVQTSTRPNDSSFFSRGVRSSAPAAAINPAMRPSSVFIAVSTTTARPVPAATLVPIKTMFARSPSGVSPGFMVPASFVTPTDSPVGADSMHLSEAASNSRASAATRSPASSARRSPATIPEAGIMTVFASRLTLAWGAVIFLSAAMDFSALNS